MRQFHVAGLGDLDIAVAAQDDADLDFFQALDQAGFVGPDEPSSRAFSKARLSSVVAEHLRCLRQHQLLARKGRADFSA